MAEVMEITSWPKQPYTFYPISSSGVTFEIKGTRRVRIFLTSVLSKQPTYRIELGETGQVSKTTIQKCNANECATAETPDILSNSEFLGFWVSWHTSRLQIGCEGQKEPITSLKCDDILKYVSFTSTGNGCTKWRILLGPKPPGPKVIPVLGGSPEWVPGEDQLPFESFIGGYETEPLYIVRAPHRGSLTPGKFVPSEGTAYIPWGGDSHEKNKFEVLCGYNMMWQRCSNGRILNGAIVAGHSEGNCQEPLYVGRASHEGNLIPGKIVPSHFCCYIAYAGREIAKNKYEVLIDMTYPSRGKLLRTISKENDNGNESFDYEDEEEEDDEDNDDD